MKTAIIFVILLFSAFSMHAGLLGGTYTIDPFATGYRNYKTFAKAVKALTDSGIGGAVKFNVSNGSYKEQITIGNIKGVSAINTITFKSANNDSSKVILYTTNAGTSSSPGYVLHLKHASFIKFKSITIRNMTSISGASNYDNVVVIDENSDSNTFMSCQLLGAFDASYTNKSAVISSGYDPKENDHNVFINNAIRHSGFGIYFGSGSSSGRNNGNVFRHNTLDSVYYGICLLYSDSSTIDANNIHIPFGGVGIDLVECGKSSIINNFISVNNFIITRVFLYVGIEGSGLDSVKIINNSINIYGKSYVWGSAAVSLDDSYYDLENNILVNNNSSTKDYAMELKNNVKEGHNDIICKGPNAIFYQDFGYANVSVYKSATANGKGDTTIAPIFNSNKDLHINNACLGGFANALKTDTLDYDGQKRSVSSTYLGADEYFPPALDAAISDIYYPGTGFCGGTQDVYVQLTNQGIDTLTDATIEWKVNDTSQSTFTWKGALATGKGERIKLGTYTFSTVRKSNYILAYPSKANGSSIYILTQNLSKKTFYPGLKAGTYSINPKGGGDYKTFREAVNDLNRSGVCGAVIFEAEDGKYNESFEIDSFPGSSLKNTVTFQSKSGDSSKVVIDTSNYGNADYIAGYTIKINGASYLNLHGLGIQNYAQYSYLFGDIIQLTGGTHHICISNCLLQSNDTINDVDYGSAIYSDKYYNNNYNTIRSNRILGKYYGINMQGYDGVSRFEKGNLIKDNIIDSSFEVGIYLYGQASLTVDGNIIRSTKASYGIYLSTSGIKDTILLRNNFVFIRNKNAGAALVTGNNHNLNIYSNSFYTTGGYACDLGINSYGGTLFFYNNILFNSGKKAVMNLYGNSTMISDYNDYFGKGTDLIYSDVLGHFSKLSSWHNSSGNDSNSISADPQFEDTVAGDLHIKSLSSGAEGKGIRLVNDTFDIDHQRRPYMEWDMGADQFSFNNNDIGISGVFYPGSVKCADVINSLPVKISNLGYKPQSGFNIHVSVDGPDTVNALYHFNSTIKSGEDTTILIPFPHILKTTLSGKYFFTVYTDLANDTDRYSDTIRRYFDFKDGLLSVFSLRTPSCAGDITFLYDSSKGDINRRIWYFDNGTTSSKINPLHVFMNPGKHIVSLKIKKLNGCSDSSARSINVDTADASFSYSFNGSLAEFIPNISGMKYYAWDFGDGSGKDYTSSPSHIFPSTNQYRVTLRISTMSGCLATWSDSVNPLFTIVDKEGVKNVPSFSIYPNPFVERASINYTLEKSAHVTMEIYSPEGKKLAELLNTEQGAGPHLVDFIPGNHGIQGEGLFILRIIVNEISIKKMLIRVY